MGEEKKELDCDTLEELFKLWQAKQVEEVNILSNEICESSEKMCTSEIFIKEHYKKKVIRFHRTLCNFLIREIAKIVAEIKVYYQGKTLLGNMS